MYSLLFLHSQFFLPLFIYFLPFSYFNCFLSSILFLFHYSSSSLFISYYFLLGNCMFSFFFPSHVGVVSNQPVYSVFLSQRPRHLVTRLINIVLPTHRNNFTLSRAFRSELKHRVPFAVINFFQVVELCFSQTNPTVIFV